MDVLMVTLDAGGNMPPFLGLGGELRRRGHRVRCLGPIGVQAAVERADLAFRPIQRGAVFDPLARVPAQQAREALLSVFLDVGYGEDVRAEVERARPDVAIIDCLLVGAQAAAEALGVPFVLLLHTLPGYLQDRFALRDLNAVRARVPLPPVASNVELWMRADRALVSSTHLLDDFDAAALPSLHYVGPIFEPATQHGQLASAHVSRSTRPLVLVGFSTTYMDQERTLACVIDALRDVPVEAVVTTGRAVDIGSLPTAANVTIRESFPHAVVVPHAALVITHAGHGTVAMALANGVPLLCLPLGRDQTFIARRVHDLGAGLAMSPDSGVAAVRSAIHTLLQDRPYREAAQQVAHAINAAGRGADNAADEIEAVVAKRQVLHAP